MNNPILVGLVYLAVALGLEFGALPALIQPTSTLSLWAPLGEMRLVALGVIMAGLVRGEVQGALYAVLCAALAGALAGPGCLGVTLFSFCLASSLGALAARWVYFEAWPLRFSTLFLLVAAESWAWSQMRHLYWPGAHVEMQWGAHLATAVVGTISLPIFTRWLKFRAPIPVPIGRKKR